MLSPDPVRPSRVGEAASAVLSRLAERSLGARLCLCEAFALAYYHEYRETHDIDAWWEPTAGEAARIERHRPFDGIGNPADRLRVADLRKWFKETFLDARLD